VKYEIRLSHRAERDLDRLDKPTQNRIVRRLEQLAEDPYDPRISAPLSGAGNLRKSRVGAWRIIYQEVVEETKIVYVVMIERRGQVYKRI
jgi:mRNA-degrading endonuclease RelE of RelBE toxin-antitoxin system